MTGLARTRSSDSFQPFLSRVVCLGGVLLLCAPWAWAQTKTRHSATAQAEGERRGTLNLEAARTNPLELRNFLKKMPKGADLHNHLSGAVYAESWIRAAAEDHLCVNLASLSFAKPQARSEKDSNETNCGSGTVAAAHAYEDQHLFDALIDAFSMRGFVPSPGVTGHDHFFDAFAKFGGTDHRHLGEWLDEVAFRANAQNEQYLELMHTPEFAHAAAIASQIGWQQVFGQTLLCFETAMSDPRFVGVNFVMPEDGYISMSDYALHMRIIAFLHQFYPKVRLTLHAGELAPGLVPYEGLCCHIRLAVEEAQAERIGHGVDVMYEDRPHELLKEMARKHILVEISLTSNDLILGISGKDHPFPLYRQFGVPVALATDDEGVSRIDLTHEYVRAVQAYGLNYRDLKHIVRTSIEHSFLPGESLWRAHDNFTAVISACGKDSLGNDKPSSSCAAFLESSEKAAQQWELERRFRKFEFEL